MSLAFFCLSSCSLIGFSLFLSAAEATSKEMLLVEFVICVRAVFDPHQNQIKSPTSCEILCSVSVYSILVYHFLQIFSMEASASSPSNLTLNATGTGDPWEITVKTRLRRFLCYGSEGNVFTARDKSRISLNNAEALLSLLQEEEDGAEVVEEIRRFMQEERAVRLDPSFFALALCSQHSKRKTREAAFKALKELCRDPAHLFAVVQYKKELREGMNCGIWGRALRTAVSDWYNKQDPMALAAAVTRCKQREGWSHKDLLRLSHTKPSKEGEITRTLISCLVGVEWLHKGMS